MANLRTARTIKKQRNDTSVHTDRCVKVHVVCDTPAHGGKYLY